MRNNDIHARFAQASPEYTENNIGVCNPECIFFEKYKVDQRVCKFMGVHPSPFYFTGMENRICFGWALRSNLERIERKEGEKTLLGTIENEKRSTDYHRKESDKHERRCRELVTEAREAREEAHILKRLLLDHIPGATIPKELTEKGGNAEKAIV
jgi:hypothetical protein